MNTSTRVTRRTVQSEDSSANSQALRSVMIRRLLCKRIRFRCKASVVLSGPLRRSVGESSIPQEGVDVWSTPVFDDFPFFELFEGPISTGSMKVEKLSLNCNCVLPLWTSVLHSSKSLNSGLPKADLHVSGNFGIIHFRLEGKEVVPSDRIELDPGVDCWLVRRQYRVVPTPSPLMPDTWSFIMREVSRSRISVKI